MIDAIAVPRSIITLRNFPALAKADGWRNIAKERGNDDL